MFPVYQRVGMTKQEDPFGLFSTFRIAVSGETGLVAGKRRVGEAQCEYGRSTYVAL